MRGNRFQRGLALTGLAGIALSATLLANPVTARAELPAEPAKPAATATITHTNSLSTAVTKLMKGSGVKAEAKALEAYWTPARMKAAKSMDRSATITRSGTAPEQQQRLNRPEGTSGSVAPAVTTKAPRAVLPPKAPRAATLPKGTSNSREAQAYYPGLPYNHPAARTNGKVFFTRGGLNYVCSATIVNSEGKSLVWTAGHCLADYKSWSYNVSFVPSYSNGSRPYGTWYARTLTTTSAWFYNRSFSDDVGAATMNRNFGWRIADYLGAQGIMWNQSANFYANAFGYPAASPYNGAYLVQANGSTYNPGNGTIYMYSGLTGGASGGAWYRNFNGSWGYVNGHNDFIYTNSPAWMYSPYYGNQVASLYNAVRYQSS
ncbi:MAG: hypothetical protein QM582_01020 [Micropruina sp.]|uniref:trypsin-like serine peptidase n=1 Tax=Micropruina sp. TaxID=2737536 RepID=UPI0039E2CCF3